LRPQRTAEGADAWFGIRIAVDATGIGWPAIYPVRFRRSDPDLIVVKSWKFEEFAGATLTGVYPNNAEAANRQNG